MASPAEPRHILLQTGLPNAPVLNILPDTTGNKYVTVTGAADPGVMIEIFVAHVVNDDYDGAMNATVLRGIVRVNSEGEFTMTFVELFQGRNIIYCLSRDDVNNLSNHSNTLRITYDPDSELHFEVPPVRELSEIIQQRQKDFRQVVYQTGKDLLPTELNEMQKIQEGKRDAIVSDLLSNGVFIGLDLPTLASAGQSPSPFYPYQVNKVENIIEFGRPNFMFITSGIYYYNGRRLVLEKNGLNKANNLNLLNFEAPPPVGEREDLVYLELWEEIIGPTDIIRAYGHQTNPTIFDNDIKNVIYGKETTKRRQMKCDIKVATGTNSVSQISAKLGHLYFPLYVVNRVSTRLNIQVSDITDVRVRSRSIVPDDRISELVQLVTAGYDPGHSHRFVDLPEHTHSEISDVSAFTNRITLAAGDVARYPMSCEIVKNGDLAVVYDKSSERVWQVRAEENYRIILTNDNLSEGNDLSNYNNLEFGNLVIGKFENIIYNRIFGHDHDGVNSKVPKVIGALVELKTEDKSNVVNSVNEIYDWVRQLEVAGVAQEIIDNSHSPHSDDDTPQQILDKLKTVDGAGSGLDAETLDGKFAAEFVNISVLNTHAIDPNAHHEHKEKDCSMQNLRTWLIPTGFSLANATGIGVFINGVKQKLSANYSISTNLGNYYINFTYDVDSDNWVQIVWTHID